MIVDTTFLIDLEREISRRQPGSAMEFLARNHSQTMRISVITFGELAEGYENPAAPALEEMIAPYGIVDIARSIGARYAGISRVLRSSGSRWGDNDLWIGATAIELGEPLVTRDLDHFSRIPGLAAMGYYASAISTRTAASLSSRNQTSPSWMEHWRYMEGAAILARSLADWALTWKTESFCSPSNRCLMGSHQRSGLAE
jgi:predicted nucleic acid-binding protein